MAMESEKSRWQDHPVVARVLAVVLQQAVMV
jgi:hypothetical protein